MKDRNPQEEAELAVLGGLLSTDDMPKEPQLPMLPDVGRAVESQERTLLSQSLWATNPKGRRAKKAAERTT